MTKFIDIENFISDNRLATENDAGYAPSEALTTRTGLYNQALSRDDELIQVTAMIVVDGNLRIDKFLVDKSKKVE